MERGKRKMPLVEFQRGAQAAAHTLLHKVVHPRDFDAGDVAHGALGMDG
jgi:hypothetical protein